MECGQHTAQSKQPVSGNRLATNICTSPCFRNTLITIAAPPGKGRDSVKLTALSTIIPETPRTEKGAQFLEPPTNVQNSTKWKHQKLFKTTHTGTRDESNRTYRKKTHRNKLLKVKAVQCTSHL